MNRKLLLAAALVFGVAGAANAAEFYLVQDTATKKCTVVEQRPTVATMTLVGPNGGVFKTRAEAEAGMKTVTVCTTK